MAQKSKPQYAKELTVDRANGRWKKFYRGKQFYFRHPITQDGYKAALEEWHAKKTELDRTAAEENDPRRGVYHAAIMLREEMLEWCRLEMSVTDDEPPPGPYESPGFSTDQVRETHDRLQRELKKLRTDIMRVNPPELDVGNALPINPLRDALEEEWEFWHGRHGDGRLNALRSFKRWAGTTEHAETISGNIDEWLKQERQRVDAKEIRPATYGATAERIETFRGFAGERPVTSLEGKEGNRLVEEFVGKLRERIAAGELAHQTAAHRFGTARAFIYWLEDRAIDTAPSKLKKLRISVPHKAIETLSLEQIETLLKEGSERTQLYLLLMLNCGMYQSDISSLRQSEVDWTAGRITRKRTKTARMESVPVVSWTLWNRTFELLKTFRADDAERALLNENGRPLRVGAMRDDGKVRHIDNVKTAYDRLCRKLKNRDEKFNPKPLKQFRKTAATELGKHAEFRAFAQYFLDQAPETLADERYVKPDQPTFDRAVRWLGEQFGYSTDPNRLKG